MTAELLAWDGTDRYDMSRVYIAIYVRPPNAPWEPEGRFFGGARTVNGPPGTGGGFVEMEYTSLVGDEPYPFQSTFVHEIGHGLGLRHVDCHGYDMYDNESIMSYNPAHHSSGLVQSATPGGFNPEDYYAAWLNRRAFPEFVLDPALHNPDDRPLDGVDQCFFVAMDAAVGPFADMPGVGYDLFFNGNRVNGPEAALMSFRGAADNCTWNVENRPDTAVECRYNGEVFHPAP